MRHGSGYRRLNRTHEHRKAMFANMASSLIEHEQIKTTLPKAKEMKRIIEKLITLGKRGDLHAPSHRGLGAQAGCGGGQALRDARTALQGARRAATRGCSRPASAMATWRRWRSSSWSIATRRPRARGQGAGGCRGGGGEPSERLTGQRPEVATMRAS